MTAMQPSGLMVDLIAWPERAVIRSAKPKFSWIVNDTEPNAYQEAFRILVATTAGKLARDEGDVWDSGEPEPGRVWKSDDRSIHVPFGGEGLASNTTYWWKVKTWNGPGNESLWSEPQAFTTGAVEEGYAPAHYRLAVTEVAPVRVAKTSADVTFIDFGRAAFGTVRMTLDCAADGEVEVRVGEVAEGAYGINTNPGGARRYQVIPVSVRKGRHAYQVVIPSDPRNVGAMAIRMPEDLYEVYPFRYCEIAGACGPIARDDVRQLAVHYPFDDEAASFASSSAVLNDVWDLCHYTMKATSFCGYYVDGDRERIPYEADAYINQLGHYGCDREYTLARRTHEYLITTPTWPTEWHLDSVLIGWNDFAWTGDLSSLRHYYEDLKAKTLAALAREDGLITLDNLTDEIRAKIHFVGKTADHFKSNIRNLIDWPQVERDGFDENGPINAVVNALHYRALNEMARMADAVGEAEDVHFFRERAKVVQASFVEKLIDPVTGLVIDGEGSTHSAMHSNMMALASGLVPEEHREAVIAFIRGKGMACSVYASQFLMEGLYEAGAEDTALALMTATGERSWAHMVYDVGTTIALEAWDDRFKPNQDWNHAWGAAPASLIPQRLMGVRPLEPGFGKILVEPRPGYLEWAEARVPTIRGSVTVRFNSDPGKRFFLEVELPANTTTRITVPAMGSDDPAVTVDGRRSFGKIVGDRVVVEGVGSGRHTVERG